MRCSCFALSRIWFSILIRWNALVDLLRVGPAILNIVSLVRCGRMGQSSLQITTTGRGIKTKWMARRSRQVGHVKAYRFQKELRSSLNRQRCGKMLLQITFDSCIPEYCHASRRSCIPVPQLYTRRRCSWRMSCLLGLALSLLLAI